MPRKRKRAADDDEDRDELSDVESIVFLHSANRVAKERKHEVSVALLKSKQCVDPQAFRKIKWHAKDILKKWRSNPGTMPLAAARFILEQCREDEESAKIATHLELDNLATTVISMHSNKCHGNCTEDIHRQHWQVAHYADDCDSILLHDAAAEEISHQHVATSSNITSTSEDVSPAILESNDVGEQSIIAHADESSFILDDHDDEGIVQKLVKTGHFTETQVLVLSGRPLGNKKKEISMRRLAAHWAVRWNQTNDAMSDFCRLFKGYHDSVFRGLPWTGKALVAVNKNISNGNKKEYPFRQIFGPTKIGVKACVGEYVHFGIEDGILGTSIGVVHWYEHVTQFRRIHLICPELLPHVFIQAMKPRNGDEFEEDIAKTWNFGNVGSDREPVRVAIHVNIDGVQWFKNSKTKGTPILGRIHSISNSKHCIKIPQAKPFIIGVFMQWGKCNVQDFVSDFIQELIKLLESTEDRPFSVELTCMICDAPQRSELKGIIFITYIFIYLSLLSICLFIFK